MFQRVLLDPLFNALLFASASALLLRRETRYKVSLALAPSSSLTTSILTRRHFSKLHSRTLAKVFRTTDLLEANWCTQKQQRWERKSVAQAAAQGKIHNHKKYAYYIYQEKSTPKVAKKCQNHPIHHCVASWNCQLRLGK